MHRRRYLAAIATATLGGLAGCSSGSPPAETSSETQPETDTPTRTQTDTPTATQTTAQEPTIHNLRFSMLNGPHLIYEYNIDQYASEVYIPPSGRRPYNRTITADESSRNIWLPKDPDPGEYIVQVERNGEILGEDQLVLEEPIPTSTP